MRWLWLAMAVLAASACAKRIPLPPQLAVSGVAELRARMRGSAPKVASYSAEVRLTYMGEQGRRRATASLLTVKPASLRYDVVGPHGGVLLAFATNGVEIAVLDVGASRFIHGPATAANVDRLLPFAPLGLTPEAWVGMLFGEVEVPAQAELAYDDRQGVFVVRWQTGKIERRVEVDPQSSRPARAQARRGDDVISEVQFRERNVQGLPVDLLIRVPEAHTEVELKLRDLETNPEVETGTFQLSPPPGVRAEHLGGGPD